MAQAREGFDGKSMGRLSEELRAFPGIYPRTPDRPVPMCHVLSRSHRAVDDVWIAVDGFLFLLTVYFRNSRSADLQSHCCRRLRYGPSFCCFQRDKHDT